MATEKPRDVHRSKGTSVTEGFSRRDFLKCTAFLGGAIALGLAGPKASKLLEKAQAGVPLDTAELYELAKAENVIYSVCLQCHTACPIKGKLMDGVLVKIDGNPYSPQNLLPHIRYATDPKVAVLVDGRLCPKGQAGVQSLYDPYRIRKVLKRAGPRGSDRWKTIPFEQAIDEIVNGGRLFADVPGEENRYVPGLKDLWALRDPKLASSMGADAKAVAAGKMSLAAFRLKYPQAERVLIDPAHPDLGPINNQFVFLAGRIEHGRKEFSKRWLNQGFGSVNWFEHTTICEQSHHIAFQQMTHQYKDGKWSGGKTHFKPDALHSEFIVYFGTSPFEANFGPTNMTEKITSGLAGGRLKIVVVDPRLSKTAARAWKWLPIKPGTDAALALAIAREMIESGRYDEAFLRHANKAAASTAGEKAWTNATYLVKIGDDGQPGALLRASEVGLAAPAGTGVAPEHAFVVMVGGRPTAVVPEDNANAVDGDLMVDTTLNGIRVKSAFLLYRELAASRTTAEWAEVCGIDVDDIRAVARELGAHGKRSAVELYRGPVQHTNGYYNAQAIIALNLLVGNVSWRGGIGTGGSHWHEDGSKSGQPFLLTAMHPGALTPFGIKLTREGARYEESTLFAGYPAKRQWFPFTNNVYQEVIPSAAAGYPYPIKALFLHMGTPGYATPAGHKQIEVLRDVEKIPLFFACDIVIGETSMYADYLFPDLSIWERWGTPHTSPDVQVKVSKVRQPMVAPLTETVTVFGRQMPISMESIMLAIAEKLGLPGYGKDGFGPGQDFYYPEDYYLRMVANIAAGDAPGERVPPADTDEMELFRRARRHLPSTVFDEKRWKAAVGADLWPHVVTVLNRGGRFEDFEKAYNGEYLGHPWSGMFSLYVENVAMARDAMTGRPFSGLPIHELVKDAGGRPVVQDGYDFHLITFKEIWGGQSRTPGNYWAQASLMPENPIFMNREDAQRLGIREGQVVTLVSRTNPDGVWDLGNGLKVAIAGRVKLVEGLRPGVVAVSWHYGHWAYGASDVVIDGVRVRGDRRRGGGLCPNAVMLVDDRLGDVCLTDPIGGSASFYDTRVRVVPL